jgi:hypothetical protein
MNRRRRRPARLRRRPWPRKRPCPRKPPYPQPMPPKRRLPLLPPRRPRLRLKQRSMKKRGKRRMKPPTGRPPLECVQTSVGFTPLSDLGTGTYMGAEGGLYPGGVNVRPAAHEAAGLQIAGTIQPLAPDGTPDPENGRIVLLSLGMSNASREFLALIQLARRDPERNSQLVIINGAQSRWTADRLYQQPAEQFWGADRGAVGKSRCHPGTGADHLDEPGAGQCWGLG